MEPCTLLRQQTDVERRRLPRSDLDVAGEGLEAGFLDLQLMAARAELPDGSTLTVLDRKGIILVRYSMGPLEQDWTGHSITNIPGVSGFLKGGKEIEFKGTKRVGFSTELSLRRSDFGFDKNAIGLIGDEALILIDCEGVRK